MKTDWPEAARTELLPTKASTKLALSRQCQQCIEYHDGMLAADGQRATFRIYGDCLTAEIFVEVSTRQQTTVASFRSALKSFTKEERIEGIAWPDLAQAFTLARTLHRKLQPDEAEPDSIGRQ